MTDRALEASGLRRGRARPGGAVEPAVFATLALATLAGCGAGSEMEAVLALPSDRASEVTITPALDLSGAGRPRWGERLVIEHIALNLDDVRLLGADPRIPAGGLELLDGPRVVAADGRPGAAASVAFPRQFLGGEDLAVFLRVASSAALEGASVEVFARLYAASPTRGGAAGLGSRDDEGASSEGGGDDAWTARSREAAWRLRGGELAADSATASGEDDDGAVDPDGEPARESEDGAVDPDGEPAHGDDDGAVDPDGASAHGGEDGAVDPDGEPAHRAEDPAAQGGDEGGAVDPDGEPARGRGSMNDDGHPRTGRSSSGLVRRAGEATPSVAFVLRDEEAVDMVATLSARHGLDVVFGIPAARWFTPEVVARIERALEAATEPGVAPLSGGEGAPSRVDDHLGVIEIRRSAAPEMRGHPGALDARSDYFLTSDERVRQNRLVRDGR